MKTLSMLVVLAICGSIVAAEPASAQMINRNPPPPGTAFVPNVAAPAPLMPGVAINPPAANPMIPAVPSALNPAGQVPFNPAGAPPINPQGPAPMDAQGPPPSNAAGAGPIAPPPQ